MPFGIWSARYSPVPYIQLHIRMAVRGWFHPSIIGFCRHFCQKQKQTATGNEVFRKAIFSQAARWSVTATGHLMPDRGQVMNFGLMFLCGFSAHSAKCWTTHYCFMPHFFFSLCFVYGCCFVCAWLLMKRKIGTLFFGLVDYDMLSCCLCLCFHFFFILWKLYALSRILGF